MPDQLSDLADTLECDLEVGGPPLTANAIAVRYRVSESHARRVLASMCAQATPSMRALGCRPQQWERV